jgi:hypothetical protein
MMFQPCFVGFSYETGVNDFHQDMCRLFTHELPWKQIPCSLVPFLGWLILKGPTVTFPSGNRCQTLALFGTDLRWNPGWMAHRDGRNWRSVCKLCIMNYDDKHDSRIDCDIVNMIMIMMMVMMVVVLMAAAMIRFKYLSLLHCPMLCVCMCCFFLMSWWYDLNSLHSTKWCMCNKYNSVMIHDDMEVSWNRAAHKSSIFNCIFHYKPFMETYIL